MNKVELETLVREYDAKSEKAMEKYQDTGTQRYYNQRCRYEDLADALRIAANASDTRHELISLRVMLSSYASDMRQKRLKHEDCSKVVDSFIKYAVDCGAISGLGDWS